MHRITVFARCFLDNFNIISNCLTNNQNIKNLLFYYFYYLSPLDKFHLTQTPFRAPQIRNAAISSQGTQYEASAAKINTLQELYWWLLDRFTPASFASLWLHCLASPWHGLGSPFSSKSWVTWWWHCNPLVLRPMFQQLHLYDSLSTQLPWVPKFKLIIMVNLNEVCVYLNIFYTLMLKCLLPV